MSDKTKYDLIIENNLNEGDPSSYLVLMRFPAMRSPLEKPADLVRLSVKPKSRKTKLEIALELNDSSYCKDTARYLATKSSPKSFANEQVDRNVYTSTREPVEDGQLFVAKLVNGKLICRPVSDILTLRSDFTHFDLKDEIDPKEELRPISVKFAGPDRQGGMSKSGSGSNLFHQQHQQNKQMDADEPDDDYQLLRYKHLTSRETTSQREALFGKPLPKVKPDPDAVTMDVELDIKPNVDKIELDVKPKIEKMEIDDVYSNQPLLPGKKSNQIKQRVKSCLLKAKIVNLEEVHQFIRGYGQLAESFPINNKEVLDALTEYAILVQGNWAVKSELLYGDSSERECTDVTGISINLFITARDYLLWLFTQSTLVSRLEYSKSVKIPDHDVLELFNQLANFRMDLKKWELKLPTDSRFLEQFPDIVTRQATFWKVRRANKLAMFK